MRYEVRYEVDGHWRGSTVYRIEDDGSEVALGGDGGEPEDQILSRDWAWVPEELAMLLATVDALRAERDALAAALADVEGALCLVPRP